MYDPSNPNPGNPMLTSPGGALLYVLVQRDRRRRRATVIGASRPFSLSTRLSEAAAR